MSIKNRKQLFGINLKIAILTIVTKIIFDIYNEIGPDGQALLFIFVPIFYLVAIQFIISSGILFLINFKWKDIFYTINYFKGISFMCGINLLVVNLVTWFLDFNFNIESSFMIAFIYIVMLSFSWNKSRGVSE